MGEQSRADRRRSRREERKREKKGRPEWERLEELVRLKVQGFIQDLLEEEVTELLGRRKSERRRGPSTAVRGIATATGRRGGC